MIEKVKNKLKECESELNKIKPNNHYKRKELCSKIEVLRWMLNCDIERDFVIKQIENELKAYDWLVFEIDRVSTDLNINIGKNIIGKYGIESSMPKANKVSDPVSQEVIFRQKKINYLDHLLWRLNRIEQSGDKLDNAKHRILYQYIVDRVPVHTLVRQIGLSRTRIFEIKKEMLREVSLYWTFTEKESNVIKNKE